MILNTFLKKHQIIFNQSQKMALGRRIASCYKTIYKEELKRVTISEKGNKMEVNDYPREFFETNQLKKIVNRFLKERQVKHDGKIIQIKY